MTYKLITPDRYKAMMKVIEAVGEWRQGQTIDKEIRLAFSDDEKLVNIYDEYEKGEK